MIKNGIRYEINNIPIKVNGIIKEVLNLYYEMKIPRTEMLQDYYAVLRYRDKLAKAFNPWEHYHRVIRKENVERGMFASEAAFDMGAIKLIKQKPTDVIRAAFYKNRNDSGFECDFLLVQYLSMINLDEDALIINPSPDMILKFETFRNGRGKNYYIVTDDTVAGLYKMQFPDSVFESVIGWDKDIRFRSVLVVARDYDIKGINRLMKWLVYCDKNVLAELPNAYFDNSSYGACSMFKEISFGISEIATIESKVFMTSPKKKSVVLLEKNRKDSSFLLGNITYETDKRELKFDDNVYNITLDSLWRKGFSLIQLWNRCVVPVKEEKEPIYGTASEFVFSKEIHLFYNIYLDKSNRYIGRAWYRKLENIDTMKYGKRVSKLIEKGLRAESKDEIICELWKILLDERVYPFVRNDLFYFYIQNRKNITLKSLWIYLRSELEYEARYDEQMMITLLVEETGEISDFVCGINSDDELTKLIAKKMKVLEDDIPIVYLEQLNLLFEIAKKGEIITHNPLDGKMHIARNRASKREQDIRQVLVKKHFSEIEEEKIFVYLTEYETDMVSGKKMLRCVKNSLWLIGAIRLFSGISLREACALKWSDFCEIEDTGTYCMLISKFLNSNEKEVLHAEREDWKRFRSVPVAPVLSVLLNKRKEYLIDLGIPEDIVEKSPIVAYSEDIESLKKSRQKYCSISLAQKYCRSLIEIAGIQEKKLLLPDADGERFTDIYKYNGDIFLSNLRMRLNHECKMTVGQINYIIGVEGNDTLSRHYCDYSNTMLQYSMVEMMNRWTAKYLWNINNREHKYSVKGLVRNNNTVKFDAGGYECNSGELVIRSTSDEGKRVEISLDCMHGLDFEIKRYRG